MLAVNLYRQFESMSKVRHRVTAQTHKYTDGGLKGGRGDTLGQKAENEK